MRKYCKAYHISEMRQFVNWKEKQEEGESELADDAVVYLWDDFTVVRSPIIPDKGLIFDEITDEWKNFCQTTLNFAIPEDLRYAYEQTQAENNEQSGVVEQASTR
ncbi:hypothetical protein [Dictyobacter formicarum]|uniref:Uncharacterized protein n=1 Tax=Dictyobacter formicarum TaxID=2778368 RepID=A0ABQ3V8K7_9CHLR|nr:hypothetical protein [Dictyobacter formicarum]GHO82460.1 hypothetical protein KSZ_04660 [Dictyobacter formicarum]